MQHYLAILLVGVLLGGCNSKPRKAPPKSWKLKNINTSILELRDGSEYQHWPSNILEATHLKEIQGNYAQNLKTLPSWISQFKTIRTWFLSSSGIQSLPAEIGQLDSTSWVNLRDNQLKSLPPEIGHLKRLRELNLAVNQLEALPPEIGDLSQLRKLYLSGNKLKSLPSEINALKELEILDLNHNQLTSLPKKMDKLDGLVALKLSFNNIRSILPNCLPQSLYILKLANNQLKYFPDKVQEGEKKLNYFPFLNELSLHNNQITKLPASLGKCPLTHLWLGVNQLTDLPIEFASLHKIQYLDLSNNRLNKIPECLYKLKTLKRLDLWGNPLRLSEVDKKVLQKALPNTEIIF